MPAFVDLYNRHWMLEKLDFQSLLQARRRKARAQTASAQVGSQAAGRDGGIHLFDDGPGAHFFLPAGSLDEKTTCRSQST